MQWYNNKAKLGRSGDSAKSNKDLMGFGTREVFSYLIIDLHSYRRGIFMGRDYEGAQKTPGLQINITNIP